MPKLLSRRRRPSPQTSNALGSLAEQGNAPLQQDPLLGPGLGLGRLGRQK